MPCDVCHTLPHLLAQGANYISRRSLCKYARLRFYLLVVFFFFKNHHHMLYKAIEATGRSDPCRPIALHSMYKSRCFFLGYLSAVIHGLLSATAAVMAQWPQQPQRGAATSMLARTGAVSVAAQWRGLGALVVEPRRWRLSATLLACVRGRLQVGGNKIANPAIHSNRI